jgi:peptide/nickel transport system ATP-binding protein
VGKLIDVIDLGIAFHNKEVVKRVSFSLEQGQTTALVGESGSGKSISAMTLLQLLPTNGLNYTHGEIRFFPPLSDSPLLVKPSDARIADFRGNGISVIFQEPMTALNPALTVGYQIAEAVKVATSCTWKEATERSLGLITEVQIPSPEKSINKYPHELSGGQRQRAMIAMALASDPKVLIADEPTTALDPTVQMAVLQLIKELQVKRQMAVLFITHDLHVVKQLADYVVVMKSGEVVESGIAQEVLSRPQHEYTQGLLACRPNGETRMSVLPTLNNRHPSGKFEFQETEKSLLKVDGLTKVYPKQATPAVNGVSFEIKTNETFGLIGESGCGKTSLSRMLLGLLPPTEGQVLWENELLVSKNQAFPFGMRKHIQMVFQDPFASLNPRQRISDTLTEPLFVHRLVNSKKEALERAAHLLELTGLSADALEKYPHNFSGGQRQRIVIARALSTEPKLLVCDEAVAALDVSVQAQVLNLLNELKSKLGLSLLFISHDMNVVYHMSNRVMVMQKGVIQEMGEAEQVFKHPHSEYTRSLLASASFV